MSRKTPDQKSAAAAASEPIVEILRSVELAIEEKRWADALARLLRMWRARRAKELATLIELVSSALNQTLPPIREKTITASVRQWQKIELERKEADVGRLLEALSFGTIRDRRTHFSALLERDEDPRISSAMVRFLQTETMTDGTRPLFTLAWSCVVKHADPRTPPHQSFSLGEEYGKHYLARLEKRLATLDVHLSPSEIEACTAIEQKLSNPAKARERVESDFLREIYERPEDHALRQVFGDWLTERSDPRGEFIQLQFLREASELTVKEKSRERELFEAHHRSWLGSLASAAHNPVFRRGFLWGCTIAETKRRPMQKVENDAAWNTVESVTVQPRALGPAWLTRRFVRLRELLGVTITQFNEWRLESADAVPALESLALLMIGYEESMQDLDRALLKYPNVRRLRLGSNYVAWANAFLPSANVPFISVPMMSQPLSRWWNKADGLRLYELCVTDGVETSWDTSGWHYHFRRNEKNGRLAELELYFRADGRSSNEAIAVLAHMLYDFAEVAQLTKLVLTPTRVVAWQESERSELRKRLSEKEPWLRLLD